jgi:transposase-like protein
MPEIPKAERYKHAIKTYHETKDDIDRPSVREIARRWGVNHATLNNRVRGKRTRKDAHEAMQRLSPGEEECLVEWIQQLEAFPRGLTNSGAWRQKYYKLKTIENH